MNIWLHRISYHAEVAYPLLEKGYLSIIGWVISSCDLFSSEAQKIAQESAVQLFNGFQFTTMLLNTGFTNLDKQAI